MTRVLVLGAYGLIGAACVRALQTEDGVAVTGMGRSEKDARRAFPALPWIIADLGTQTEVHWRAHLKGIDVVVNAAGALQDGARDDLGAIHESLIERLIAGAAGRPLRVVQISAAGVAIDASTEFFRSKARGDARLAASALDWVILRPTLVIGANAYGGTALLRAVAAVPGMAARVLPGSAVQTIALDELARAVVACAQGRMPMQRSYDLSEAETRGFPETVDLVRSWLGVSPPRITLPLPTALLRLVGRVADGLGRLGWRSPLRSTAIRTLEDGVQADPGPWRAAGGDAFSSLPQTLARMPATLQDRWFARAYLMMPLSIALLSLFWLASGLIGLWQFDAARAVLTIRGVAAQAAGLAVIAGALADIALGAAILFRPWARRACLGMLVVSLAYLLGATVFAPDLWADPLGPLVKVLPMLGLVLLVRMMLEER